MLDLGIGQVGVHGEREDLIRCLLRSRQPRALAVGVMADDGARVTEVGTLELWCVARGGSDRWRLELNIREREP